jgi:hypothetical protein
MRFAALSIEAPGNDPVSGFRLLARNKTGHLQKLYLRMAGGTRLAGCFGV